MSYLVLARKYRPQTFDQVIKQDHVTQTLSNAISAGRVAHAILLSGPRGTGKTTVARILAKAMNCKNGPTRTPCNDCRSCREITSGSAVDVFEIDGASNNSVDQIRDLRENVKYMPAHSRYKIYIIDEVHMLSIAAFNALLKTLEEPPSHVMFIFATTEPHKIPITILSRCQRHDFRRIDAESISKHMEGICAKEGIDIAIESLGLIAREAGGSMRDAQSLLDQVTSSAGGKITHEHVIDMLGVIDRKILFDISGAVIREDIHALLDILDEIYDHGHDMKKLYSELVEHFRNLLVLKMVARDSKLVDVPGHEIDQIHDQVKEVSPAYLTQVFDILFKEESAMRFSSQPKLALEMIFIRLFQVKPALPIDELIEKLDDLRKNISETPESYADTEKRTVKSTGTAETVKPFCQPPPEHGKDPDRVWGNLFSIISEKHPSLAANLKNATLTKLTDQSIEIEVNGNGFNINIVRRSESVNIIEKVCNEFFGKKMELVIKTKTIEDDKSRHKKTRAGRSKQEALNHPLVADAVEIFNGKIVDVKIL
ncbi:DNA polymerase III subunit gamma/tau [Thermodesulfobacteriota bacterium]